MPRDFRLGDGTTWPSMCIPALTGYADTMTAAAAQQGEAGRPLLRRLSWGWDADVRCMAAIARTPSVEELEDGRALEYSDVIVPDLSPLSPPTYGRCCRDCTHSIPPCG